MATTINGAGSTAGIYQDAGGTTHGYTDMGGVFTTVDQPGAAFNQALGINNSNTTVSYFAVDKILGQMGQSAYSQHGGCLPTSMRCYRPPIRIARPLG